MFVTTFLLALYAPIWVGKFATAGAPPAPWRVVPLKGAKPTTYRTANVGGRPALEAVVDSSMALLTRPVSVDLASTPILCWRWFTDGPVAKADMARKSGDDYAARVYAAFDMPDSALSASTKMSLGIARKMFGMDVPDAAVTYVWDNVHPVGTARKSAYTSRSQLIVAETGAGRAGAWVSERADVGADFAKAFENKPGKLTHIAIAADGDNTKSKGRAAFADIHFVKRSERCAF